MPIIPVSNLQDSRLDPYRSVRAANLTCFSGRFIVEGRLLLERLLASDFAVESLLVDENRLDVVRQYEIGDIPTLVLPGDALKELVGFPFHRGIMACGLRKENPALGDVLPPYPQPASAVVCISIRNPENMGGILRNCAAFGVDAVILGPGCCDPLSRRVSRVSMGAAWQLAVIQPADCDAVFHELSRTFRMQTFATVLDSSAESLYGLRAPHRFALVFGSEGFGLEATWIERCHRQLTLPMQRQTDSLNVAVASGIFLFAMKQPNSPDLPP